MLTRNDILEEAIIKCLSEMYKQAQPPLDWNKLYKNAKSGKQPEDKHFVYHHYLSSEEHDSIMEEFMSAYRISSTWKDDINLVIDYLEKGGTKDKYIPERVDEDGFKHPGYRGYEKTPKLADIIGEDNTKEVLGLITSCRDYYMGNYDERNFRFTLFNYSPTCNKEEVQKYWKDKNIIIYDTELDPEKEKFVKVTPKQIKLWKKALKSYKDDPYMKEIYTKLLEKYEKIYNNS